MSSLNQPLAWMDAVDAARKDLADQIHQTYQTHQLPLSEGEAQAVAVRLMPPPTPTVAEGYPGWDRPVSTEAHQRELAELEVSRNTLLAERKRGRGRYWLRTSLGAVILGIDAGLLVHPILGFLVTIASMLGASIVREVQKDRVLSAVTPRIWALEEWIPDEEELALLATWLDQPTLRAHLIALRHSGVPLLVGDLEALTERAQTLLETEPQRQLLDMIDRAAAQPSSRPTP